MRYLPYTLPILTSQSINLIRFIILNEAGYVVYYSTALLNSIFSPSGNTNVCSYPTPNAFAIAIISSKETVPRFSFLLKFWGVCPIRLQSSARLIFCFCIEEPVFLNFCYPFHPLTSLLVGHIFALKRHNIKSFPA